MVERPPLSLDFVISQDIELGEGTYNLGVKLTNILGEGFSATQTDEAGVEARFQEYDRGQVVSVSLKRDF